jgi:hypothetical protein
VCNPVFALLAFLAMSEVAAQRLPDLPVSSLERLSGAPRPVTQPATRTPAAAGLDGPAILSVTLPTPTPLSTVLQLLFRGTAFSTVADSPVRGTYAGELRDLTLRQALEAVLSSSGFVYDVRGTVIHISPRNLTEEGRR